MFGSRDRKEQEVRVRQERQSSESREQEAQERQESFKRQLAEQAQTVEDLLEDPRHVQYLEMLKTARMFYRSKLKELMERTIEEANQDQMIWFTSRIELLSDILETPEQILIALADQRENKENGAKRPVSA